MLSKLFNFFFRKKVVEKDEHEQIDLLQTEPEINKLEFLPFVVQEAFRKQDGLQLVIFDKSCQTAYQIDQSGLEHIYDLYHRGENDPFFVPSAHVLSTLTVETIGWLNEEKNKLFTFIDNRHNEHIHRSFFQMCCGNQCKAIGWWGTFGVNSKDLRHVRLSHQVKEGRMYKHPLSEWFKPKPKKDDLNKEKEVIFINTDNNQISRVINERWYKIEINHSYIRVYMKRVDKEACRKIIKEVRRLRRSLLSHHIIISCIDNRMTLPKELEVLKEL